jgi:hypothetical protein
MYVNVGYNFKLYIQGYNHYKLAVISASFIVKIITLLLSFLINPIY